MVDTSGSNGRNTFSRWLRTGKAPSALGPDGLELKFNPWHDSADGRFTFVGAGSQSGASANDRPHGLKGRAPSLSDHSKSRAATLPKTFAANAGPLARNGWGPAVRASVKMQPTRMLKPRVGNQRNPVAEFATGVGEGLYAVGEETVTGVRAALTTNPVTTVRNAGRGITGIIDSAVAAEDTPARVQVARAVDAVANASARDMGRATGSVAGNVALAAVPEAALSRVSRLSRLNKAVPRTTFDPPQIGWVKENLGPDTPARRTMTGQWGRGLIKRRR